MDLDINSVEHRQHLFSSTLRSHILRKVSKYQTILLKSGIHLSEQSYDIDDTLTVPRSQSFEDHIELVIGQKSAIPNARKTFWKIGNRISAIKLFRWIYLIVQRTKAARILQHLDGISDIEVRAVIEAVGQELSVAYEYQLCVLEGDIEIVKLAQHAGACILTYLNSPDAHYATENLLQAILEVKPQSGTNKEILRTRPLHVNNQSICLRWRLSQVLKHPGLRILADCESCVLKNPNLSEQSGKSSFGTERNGAKTACNPTAPEGATCSEQAKNRYSPEENGANESKDENSDIASSENKTFQKVKCRRRINAVDMDYKKGEMKITEYSVEVSDFSPVGNDTSLVDDGDSTSVEEDFDSECMSLELNSINKTYQGANDACLARAPKDIDTSRTGINSQELLQRNGIMTCKNCAATANTAKVKNDKETVNKIQTECGPTDDSSQFRIPGEGLTRISTHQADQNTSVSRPPDDNALKTLQFTQETPYQQTLHPELAMYDQRNKHIKHDLEINPDCFCEGQSFKVNESEKHINSSKHIYANTYQFCSKPGSNIYGKTDPDNCDNNCLPEYTIGDKRYIFYGCFTPYGARCRPQIYGYRGPLHVWSEKSKQYTLIYNDTVTVTRKHQTEVTACPSDFHQSYIPKTVCRH